MSKSDSVLKMHFGDPDKPSEDRIVDPEFEISKLLAIIDFALKSSAEQADDPFFAELGLAKPADLKKRVNGVFQFVVKSKSGKTREWYADMKKDVRIRPGKAPGKADVTIAVSDNDMVALSLGKMNPQKGKLRVKGNLMLGLRMNIVLNEEVNKMTAKL